MSLMGPDKIVGDLIYKDTSFLKSASKKGCKTFNGLGMLLYQGVLAFELWTGVKPPDTVMREALLSKMKV
jgi:shikimate dehydrogenase